jgi:multidrug resistance efflux pump
MSKYSVTVRQFEDQLVEAEARVRRLELENEELRCYIKDYRINLQRALDNLQRALDLIKAPGVGLK